MSYTLGFFAADGNMVKTKRGTHFISFYSADRSVLVGIRRAMKSSHKLSTRKSVSGTVYRLQIGSKNMYFDLHSLSFREQKARRMELPKIPKQFLGDFIRGYFDGDGNVWVGQLNKRRKTPTQVITVSFTSGSKSFLQDLLHQLQCLRIRGGALYTSKKKEFSRLTLSTNDALKLGEIMYNGHPKLYLQRKKLRFEEYRRTRCGRSSTG